MCTLSLTDYIWGRAPIFIEMTWNISSPGQSSLKYSCEQIYMGAFMFRIQTLEVHGLGLHVQCFDCMAILAYQVPVSDLEKLSW
mgnify:CR=1 FL=1